MSTRGPRSVLGTTTLGPARCRQGWLPRSATGPRSPRRPGPPPGPRISSLPVLVPHLLAAAPRTRRLTGQRAPGHASCGRRPFARRLQRGSTAGALSGGGGGGGCSTVWRTLSTPSIIRCRNLGKRWPRNSRSNSASFVKATRVRMISLSKVSASWAIGIPPSRSILHRYRFSNTNWWRRGQDRSGLEVHVVDTR